MKYLKYNNETITPSKVICIGRNYVEHIEELNNETPDSMVVFNKPNSAISDKLRYFSEDTNYTPGVISPLFTSVNTGVYFS